MNKKGNIEIIIIAILFFLFFLVIISIINDEKKSYEEYMIGYNKCMENKQNECDKYYCSGTTKSKHIVLSASNNYLMQYQACMIKNNLVDAKNVTMLVNEDTNNFVPIIVAG